jgi:hypothetical protein
LPDLPPNKTVVQVLGDFMKYLYQCVRSFIQETHANGEQLWASLGGQVDFVLTHPNGWEGTQQTQMRKAAIYGGLIRDQPDEHARVHFVTEGEASLHYCIGNNYSSDVIKVAISLLSLFDVSLIWLAQSGQGIIIIDAGGGTIDLSAYYMKEAPSNFEEIAPAVCASILPQIYWNRLTRDVHRPFSRIYIRNPPCSAISGKYVYLRLPRTRIKRFLSTGKLCNSRYNSPEDIQQIAECFDKSAKLGFRDSSQPCSIKFGTARHNDSSVDIKKGLLKLQG